jgi:hypothetical protein
VVHIGSIGQTLKQLDRAMVHESWSIGLYTYMHHGLVFTTGKLKKGGHYHQWRSGYPHTTLPTVRYVAIEFEL